MQRLLSGGGFGVPHGAGTRRAVIGAAGGLLALAVVYPWIDHGWLLVLDWVTGPRDHLPPAAHGFGGITASVPIEAVLVIVGGVISPELLSWVLIAAALAMSVWSVARLVREVFPDAPLTQQVASALVWACNPVVFERLGAGQVFFLLGYSLLPCAVAAVLVARSPERGVVAPALWIAGLGAISIHFLWIMAVFVVAVAAFEHSRRRVGRWILLLGLVGVLNLYLVAPLFGGHIGVAVGSSDLSSYRTAGDPTFGLYMNALGLYGFWRAGPELPKGHLSGWPILLAAILLVVGYGVVTAWRAGRRRLVGCLGVASIFSYFLALGDQGPTGSIFRLLYDHVPGFNVMREPEKFIVLLAISYAIFFGVGVSELLRRMSGRRVKLIGGVVAIALPLAYTPTLFDGLGGQLRSSEYPTSWIAADRVMGDGPGRILFLPWHQYLAFPFTHGQVIANPAPALFRRPVISGDNVEVGYLASDSTSKRSAYLQQLYSDGPHLTEFGHLVAQLGVSYVVLSHTVDYRAYGWLGSQHDLRQVFSSSSLTVWRNEAAMPKGSRVTSMLSVPSVAAYIAAAQRADLRGVALVVRPGAQTASGIAAPQPLGDVRRRSLTSYAVATGPPGWVVLPEDADPAWSLAGRSAVTLADGVVAIPASRAAGSAEFTTWTKVKIGYGLSGLATVALAGVALWERRHRRAPAASGAAPQDDAVEAQNVLP